MREAESPTAADPIAPEVTVATVVGTSEEVAGASQDMALVFPFCLRQLLPLLPLEPTVSAWTTMCCCSLMPLIVCQS